MSRPLPSAALALLLCGGAAAEEPPQPSPSPDAPPAHPGDAATRFPRENLRALPRPADPWSLLREVPGVVLDRVSVGGSETGLQQIVVSGGDAGGGTVWTLDGIDVTDPAALGSLAVFPDMDAVETVLVRTRAVDVRVRTPGVRVDLLLRPPPERFRGELHLRGSDDALQSDNLPAQLAERPFFRNRTERLTELGAEAGGGLRQGTLRLWGALSRNEHRQQSFTGHEETLRVTDLAAKARWDGRQGTLSALALRSEKVHEGRDTGLTTDPSARWRQSGPSHVVALEGRRGLGGFETFARLSWLDGGFRLDAEGGPQANVFEDFRGVLQGSYYTFATDRPRLQALAETLGARDALGLRHTMLAGLGYRRSQVETSLEWPGSQVLGFERQSVFFRTFGLTGFALPTRAQAGRSVHDHFEAYAQDRMRRGRFEVTLGLRVDRQAGHNLASSVEPNPIVPGLLPARLLRRHAFAVHLARRAAEGRRLLRPRPGRAHGRARLVRGLRSRAGLGRRRRSTTPSGVSPRPSRTTGWTATATTRCRRASWTCCAAGWAARASIRASRRPWSAPTSSIPTTTRRAPRRWPGRSRPGCGACVPSSARAGGAIAVRASRRCGT